VVAVGIITPIVTLVPGAHGRWEREAGLPELTRVAQAADRLGYHHLTCAEHVAVPASAEAARGATYWDPLATFGYLAAHTSHIRLATSVLVLGYHHPLTIAKRYGTLDVVCGGRLVLGLGVGTLAEEFDLLGVSFEDRGDRADDALRALRASLSKRVASYDGRHHSYDAMIVDPHATQAHVPLWIGGRTRRSLRRAVELADGWVPFGLTAEELGAMLAEVDAPDGFEVVLNPTRALDPMGHPEAAEHAMAELVAVGATVVSVRIVAHSCEEHLDQLAALAELAGLPGPGAHQSA
jgi:probable F420-dependent oxidoreductase